MKTVAYAQFFRTTKDGEQLSSRDFILQSQDVFSKAILDCLPNKCESFAHLLNDYSQCLKTIVQLEMVAEMQKSVTNIQMFL